VPTDFLAGVRPKVWLSDRLSEPRCAVAVAIALRESLIALAAARLAGEGQQTKMEPGGCGMMSPRNTYGSRAVRRAK
jgi:hypothetical protein